MLGDRKWQHQDYHVAEWTDPWRRAASITHSPIRPAGGDAAWRSEWRSNSIPIIMPRWRISARAQAVRIVREDRLCDSRLYALARSLRKSLRLTSRPLPPVDFGVKVRRSRSGRADRGFDRFGAGIKTTK